MTKMVRTRQSAVKRKKNTLPTNNNLNNNLHNNLNNININSNEVYNLVNGTTDSIIVPETQT